MTKVLDPDILDEILMMHLKVVLALYIEISVGKCWASKLRASWSTFDSITLMWSCWSTKSEDVDLKSSSFWSHSDSDVPFRICFSSESSCILKEIYVKTKYWVCFYLLDTALKKGLSHSYTTMRSYNCRAELLHLFIQAGR